MVGIGLHSGRPARVRLEPAGFGEGLGLQRWGDPKTRSIVGLDVASAPGGCSTLETSALTLQTVEHLLAAVVALGITDLTIGVDGPELPALDGSAGPWCGHLIQAGCVTGPPLSSARVMEPFTLEAHGGRFSMVPHDGLRVEVSLDQGPGLTGRVAVDLPEPLEGGLFALERSFARTYVRVQDVGRLRGMGRGRGATPRNTLLLAEGRSPTCRMPLEPVWHKLVDAVGDLGLLGCPLVGHVTVENGSHALHQEALKRWWQAQGEAACR